MKVIRAAAAVFVALTLLCGVLYPLIITAVAQAAFPERANGSQIKGRGAVVGSSLIGQPFADPKYFWGRPSSTQGGPYNTRPASGSNLGPTNPALIDSVRARLALLHAADPTNAMPVPVDLVTASGSGLDPHISPAAAEYQVPRVARARGWQAERVRKMVLADTEPRTFGFLGEPRVNVLELNRELDAE